MTGLCVIQPTTTWTGTAHPSCLCLVYTIRFSEVVGRKRTLSSLHLDCPGYRYTLSVPNRTMKFGRRLWQILLLLERLAVHDKDSEHDLTGSAVVHQYISAYTSRITHGE
ncbi:hypothetical protein SCLCIDRAFT_1213672 [Scleroderma citrinum Foug A]|uniref:Uncharacterized protein n=1 Tax=Scleroderma citrinum Foug A TaxID=1036808 RepID=A0A0C3AG26_9AGAM|nr:hypothetical protein SCLCIDRAFT_1213672 [Scleroderma citrinum Foug A]